MIEHVAERAALRIKAANPGQTTSVDIMKYGLIMAFNGGSVLLLTVGIGWLSGRPGDTLLTLGAFALLRFFSGGYHFKSAWACIVFSTALLSVLPHIPISSFWIWVLTAASVCMVALLAPSKIENQTRIPKKYFPILKMASICMVVLNFFLLSPILAKVFLSQAILLTRIKEV